MRLKSLMMNPVALLLLGAGVAVGGDLTPVPSANPKAPGIAAPNVLSPELIEAIVAQGSIPWRTPQSSTRHWEHDPGQVLRVPEQRAHAAAARSGPGPRRPRGGDQDRARQEHLPRPRGHKGPDPGYDYGKHFLFQGHEVGPEARNGRRPRSPASTSTPTQHTA